MTVIAERDRKRRYRQVAPVARRVARASEQVEKLFFDYWQRQPGSHVQTSVFAHLDAAWSALLTAEDRCGTCLEALAKGWYVPDA